MKRNEIDEKFKWDISSIYKTIEDYEKDFNIVKENITKFKEYKGNFLDSVDRFLEFMELYETTSRKIQKLSMYSHLQIDVDPKNEEIQNLESRIDGLGAMYSESLVFMDLEIGQNEAKCNKLLEDERCKKYSRMFYSILRYNPHKLSDETEEVINKAMNAMNCIKSTKNMHQFMLKL